VTVVRWKKRAQPGRGGLNNVKGFGLGMVAAAKAVHSTASISPGWSPVLPPETFKSFLFHLFAQESYRY